MHQSFETSVPFPPPPPPSGPGVRGLSPQIHSILVPRAPEMRQKSWSSHPGQGNKRSSYSTVSGLHFCAE